MDAKVEELISSKEVSFGRTAAVYAQFRPGPPDSFYERLQKIRPLKGLKCLDLGMGPGLVACELARRGAEEVVGLDIAPEMVAEAQKRAAGMGLSNMRFVTGTSHETGLAPESIDLVIVSQAWHWMDATKTAAEVKRIAKPGCLFVLTAFCYLPSLSPVVAATEELIVKYNPRAHGIGMDGVAGSQVAEVEKLGFLFAEAFCYNETVEFSFERWKMRMFTCNGVGSGLIGQSGQLDTFSAELDSLLRTRFSEPLLIPHRIWTVVAQVPPSL